MRRVTFDQAYKCLVGGPVRRFAAGASGELPDREAKDVVKAGIGHFDGPPTPNRRPANVAKPKIKAKPKGKAKRGKKK